ncbi:MAG: hypothetical protein HYS88_00670 [Candidatus Colwellbacteria bacterium]|nr:hypothetical protein [Candidatus Colwellbacteria bacterium]
MTWYLWLLVALGIWWTPGTVFTLAVHGIRNEFGEREFPLVAERIVFFGIFLWPLVVMFVVWEISEWARIRFA